MNDYRRLLEAGKTGAGATDAELAAAEKALGIEISGEYRDFLRQVGWASIAHHDVNGLGGDVDPAFDLVETTLGERQMDEPLPEHLLPLRNDGGGNLDCLDLSQDPACVVWRNHERPDATPRRIADSFSKWLERLVERAQISR